MTRIHDTTTRGALDGPILNDGYKAWIDRLRQRWNVPGVGVALVRADESGQWQEETYASGVRDSYGHPMESNTLSCIASNSKLFCAVAIGLLIHDEAKIKHSGKPLTWTTKLRDIFPGWRLTNKHAQDFITVSDLLSMRSGLPRHDAAYLNRPVAHLLDVLPNLPFSAELRETFQYNNMHYLLLAHVVAEVSGQAYHDFVKQRVFDPLGMSDSTYDAIVAGENGRRADSYLQKTKQSQLQAAWKAYVENWDKKDHPRASDLPLELKDIPEACKGDSVCFGCFTDDSNIHGAGDGGLWTTPHDLCKWLRELMDTQTIPREVLHQITQPHMIADDVAFPLTSALKAYGFGTEPHEYRGFLAYTHDGAVPGQMSTTFWSPSANVGVAVVCNDDTMGWTVAHVISHELVDRVLGKHEPQGWERVVFGKGLVDDDDDEDEEDDDEDEEDDDEDEEDDDEDEEDDDEDEDEVDVPSKQNLSKEYEPAEEQLKGTYAHPSYPLINLHLLSRNDYRHALLPQLNDQLDEPIDLRRTIYYTPYEVDTSDTLIFVHEAGRKFRWFLYGEEAVIDHGKETGETLLVLDSEGVAVFVLPGAQEAAGIGMFDDFWGGGEGLKRKAVLKNVQDKAEVWFARQ